MSTRKKNNRKKFELNQTNYFLLFFLFFLGIELNIDIYISVVLWRLYKNTLMERKIWCTSCRKVFLEKVVLGEKS